MTIPEIAIKRHVLAFMLSAVLILFGFIAYNRIGIDRFPTIEFPVISVSTILKGGNPEIIDASITNIIETSVNSIPGITHIQSMSYPGLSVVAVTFDLDKNVDVAFNEVQAKVNQILNTLPQGADLPVVAKVDTNSNPILWLTLQGDRTVQQLNVYATNTLKKQLETIEGVGQVLIGGKRERTLRVNLFPEKMAAFGIASQDITQAFAREHGQFPGGFLVSQNSESLLKLDFEHHHPKDLAKIIVAYRGNAPVRIQDIGTIEDGLEDYRQLARFNGQPAVGLGIIKIANSNTVAIIDAIKEKLHTTIIPELPAGMQIAIASNDGLFINDMVKALREHLLAGTLLAAAVVWVFLRSIRSTLIVATAIPVSLLGAIAVMYFCGYTFNTMTLLALLLLIGVVVDDAIVVLENIFRHRQEIDPNPTQAAILGSNQVFFAVLAATLSLVSIFGPVIFLGGIIGKFFQSFAVVVTCGVLVSLFVSITLTPMLCAKYLTLPQQQGRIYQWLSRFFLRMDQIYQRLLTLALQNRWKVVLVTLLMIIASSHFFAAIGKGFVPEEDEGRFLVTFRTPLGSSIEYTQNRLALIEQTLTQHPEIECFFSTIGPGPVNQGMVFVRMKPLDERKLRQQDLLVQLRQELSLVPGIKAFAGPVPFIGGQRGEPLNFALVGPQLPEVAKLSQLLQQQLSTVQTLGDLDLTLQMDLPHLSLQIDRTRAAFLGISAADIALAVNMLSGGFNVAKYNDEPGDGQRYDIRLKANETDFSSKEDLSKIFLKTQSSELIRLDTIASFQPTLGAAEINRLDLQYAALFFSTPTIPLGDAVNIIKEFATPMLPSGYHLRFLGQAEEFAKTSHYMSFAFILATVLLYMVLASQFNSFVQPFIIMAAQPLAVIGGVFALWVTDHSLNIYSMIGLVLLIGLVAKNSILLVELTNQFRQQGKGINVALIEACPIRLRPVLMTSLTVILALLPASLGIGAGAQTNAPLAVAVIGGMLSSTLLTLIIVPAVYSLAEQGLLHVRQLNLIRFVMLISKFRIFRRRISI